ncbi:hypothetical protein C5167_026870 [Papaver somniferum]|nr:hypothetical protein C5167_026870 [Papaver somniferum]
MARIFSILLFITCVYYSGRMSSPIVTKKLKEETAETIHRRRPFPFPLFGRKFEVRILKLKEDKDLLWFEKPLVTLLFDYKRWNRPVRYIKNDQFEDDVRDEMSHYFFFTCESDGKERISFTYPPSFSIFLEMIKGKILLSTIEKPSSEELGSLKLDVLEKRIRLCNDETEQDCLPESYDPFLNGTRRGSEN